MKKIISISLLLLGFLPMAYAQTGTWSGVLDIQGSKLSIVFHLDEENPTADSPDQGVKGIPVQVERSELGKVTIKIPSLNASYEGQWVLRQIVGTFKQMGFSFPLTLTPGEHKLNRPQTPKPPFPYAQEELTFVNGDAILKGTLVLPEGYSRKTPVLIMVTGSGLQNRDEEVFEHKPFAVIADALARTGVATLRYDDRGFGESTGDVVNCTTEDFKNDALAGISMLRDRFDKVGILGHSEGGSIGLMLAAEKQVDFLISLAGMVISGKETLLWQNRLSLAAAGIPEETIDTYCALLGEAFDRRVQGGDMPRLDGRDLPDALKQNYLAVLMQIRTPYMKYFLSMDMRPFLGKITCPVLALNGTRDKQVECGTNLAALKNGLPESPKNRIEALEGLNHLFQHCRTGMTQEYREIEETMAPEVLEAIIRFIRSK